MDNKTWVNFREHYQICKETSEVKSCARQIKNTRFNKTISERIMKPQKGFLSIQNKTYRIADLYEETFGVRFKDHKEKRKNTTKKARGKHELLTLMIDCKCTDKKFCDHSCEAQHLCERYLTL